MQILNMPAKHRFESFRNYLNVFRTDNPFDGADYYRSNVDIGIHKVPEIFDLSYIPLTYARLTRKQISISASAHGMPEKQYI